MGRTVEVYRLIKPGVFRKDSEACHLDGSMAVVRPEYLSICAADQRYWSGRRDPEALAQKLPMALIHEAVGVVEQDATGTFEPGQRVVLVPNIPAPDDPDTASKENYSRASKFASSSADGFMRSLVALPAERLVACDGIDPHAAAMSELISVCGNALEPFDAVRHVQRKSCIGIWGDGALGYLLAAVLRKSHPELRLILFGTHESKMARFDFVDECHNVRRDFRDGLPAVDHAFECVGGVGGSTSAIDQIIDCIKPQGVISLMGVSEQPVPINTRMVLEKGLTLQGNSRSSKHDFERAVELLRDEAFAARIAGAVAHIQPVKTMEDMKAAFKYDETHPFKTVMHWEV